MIRLKTATYETVGQIASAAAGATNAYTTNNFAGVGRIDVELTGLTGGYAIAYQVGQKLGDAAAVITGGGEFLDSGAGAFVTAGAASPVAIRVAIQGAVTTGGAKNLFTPIKTITPLQMNSLHLLNPQVPAGPHLQNQGVKNAPALTALDGTGKVHGPLPKPGDIKKYTQEHLKIY